MKYAMTVKSNSTQSFWEICKANNLAAAKRECTLKLGPGAFLGDTLAVSEVHNGEYLTVATKTAGYKKGWKND